MVCLVAGYDGCIDCKPALSLVRKFLVIIWYYRAHHFWYEWQDLSSRGVSAGSMQGDSIMVDPAHKARDDNYNNDVVEMGQGAVGDWFWSAATFAAIFSRIFAGIICSK